MMRRFPCFLLLLSALHGAPLAGQDVHTVTLADCQEMAALHDPALLGAQSDLQAARAQRSEARWEFAPRISLTSAGYYSLRPLVRVAPEDILDGYWAGVLSQAVTDVAWQVGITPWYQGFQRGWGASVTAVQPLFAGGRIVNGNRLADLGVRAGELKLSLARRESAASVEQKFRLGVSLQEKMQTLRQAQQLLDSLELAVSAAVSAGLISDSDLLQVRLRQRELASAGIQLRSGLKLAKMDLFNAVGLPFRYLDIDLYVLDGEEWSGVVPPRDVLLADESAYVPEESELLALQVEAARLQKRMAVGEYLPQAAIGAGYGYSDLQGTRQGSFNGVGFATLQIPLTDLAKASARSRRYESEAEKARTQQEYLERQLALQVYQLRLAVESAWEQLGVAEEAVRVARDSAGKLRARYDAGQVTMSELLQAELAVRQAEEERIDRKMEYNIAVNSYLRRCGKL